MRKVILVLIIAIGFILMSLLSWVNVQFNSLAQMDQNNHQYSEKLLVKE
jgi:hypothetical protein